MTLKERREELGLTQKQVANRCGISYQSYQRYEILKIIPNALLAIRIAKVLETSVEALWGYLNIDRV